VGTDICLHIEYRLDGVTSAWSDGAIDVERDYALFGALAGVCAIGPTPFPPRGLPSDLSPEVFERYYAFIIDPENAARWSGFAWMSNSDARSLLQSGKCHAPPTSYTKRNMTSPLGYVSIPGLHTPSWLTHDEVVRALAHAHSEARGDWCVVLDLLASLERRLPGAQSRIVFWFSG
jgi:hypothetical protein